MEKKKNVHSGHRQRMKQEFLAQGLDGWPDHRVLELLLFYAIPQKDVNELAHELVDHFGSLPNVLHATREQLLAVNGVGENTAALIMLVLAVGRRYHRDKVDLSDILRETREYGEYLKPFFFGLRSERVVLLCMDTKMKLLNEKVLDDGVADEAQINPRKIMETALACNATRVVLAHNHISGLAMPSTADLITTRQLDLNLRQAGITLHDHVIIVDDDMVSLRESGYLKG